MAINLKDVQRGRIRHFAKYALVSVVATLTSLTTLGLLVGLGGWSSVWANILATSVGTVPSFELNRRWVWSQRGQRARLDQVVPFCALSLAGLVVSTFAVHIAGDATISSTRLVHTGAVEVANFGSYGALWIFQFVLCDKVLFKKSLPASSVGTYTASALRNDRFGEIDSAA